MSAVAGPRDGTGKGVSYGCPCGQHIGMAATAAEAIAAVRACPGRTTPPTTGRPRPAWLADRTPRPAKPERTT